MRHLRLIRNFATLLVLAVIVGAVPAFSQSKKPVLKRRPVAKKKVVVSVPVYTVENGTTIRTRMNETINSKTAKVGDSFTATITEPVYSTNGTVVIPVGSTVKGRVDTVKPAAKGGKPGEIGVSFNQIRLPNGRTRAINGSLTDLDEGKTVSDNESTASGKKMKNRKLIFIGGGTAGGAVLGAAIGGGKGVLIGGLLGAGGGFLGDKLTKGPEAEVKSGTEFGVLLNQSISLPKFAEAAPVNP